MTTTPTDNTVHQALRAYHAGDHALASTLCTALLDCDRRDINALKILAAIASDRGELDDAARFYEQALRTRAEDPELQCGLGRVRASQGRLIEATRAFDRALTGAPEHPEAIAGKVDALRRRGRIEPARRLLEPVLKRDAPAPELIVAATSLEATLRRHDAVLSIAGPWLDRQHIPGHLRVRLLFLCGRAHESLDQVDQAFVCYETANNLLAPRFDADAFDVAIDQLIETFSPAAMRALPRSSCESERPIFVAGLPRCGSTLIEQVLHAHPDAHGGGELVGLTNVLRALPIIVHDGAAYPGCVQALRSDHLDTLARQYLSETAKLGGRAQRLVDKNLVNYQRLGLIALMFSRARIIHCRRDPIDHCFACFAANLRPAIYPFASRFDHLARAWQAYDRLMQHWQNVLGERVLDVVYERVIDDFEAEARRIVAFCGLNWHDRCLAPHQAGRTVNTLSEDQVRQPVFSSSVGRAARFAAHLRPLQHALQAQAVTT